MKKEAQAKGGHGLKFQGENQKDIFQTAAIVTEGTFTDYLDLSNASLQKGTVITLNEALLRIIETAGYYTSSPLGQAEIFQVQVEAYHSGKAEYPS